MKTFARFARLAILSISAMHAPAVPKASAASALLREIPPAIRVEFTAPVSGQCQAAADRWMQRAKNAVTTYYGAFPVDRLRIRISPCSGRRPSNGVSYGWNGPLITIALGRDATDADLADDWLFTHEMLHLGFPSLAERHHWLEEGIATYVEPIARARAGQISTERAWADLVDGIPQGQPATGDRGLDFTHTWGRTYWGGALFCLRADVEIRRRTANRFGLEHALRAIRVGGGTIEVEWPLERVLAIGDQATGVPVLRELYDEMKATPVNVPLDALWRQLGIQRRGRTVTFDDTAPFSAIRRAIIP